MKLPQVDGTPPPDRTFLFILGAVAVVTAAITALVYGSYTPPAKPPRPEPVRPKTLARKKAGPPEPFSPPARIRREAVFRLLPKMAAFKRLGDPKPGDWLHSFRESGQTLEEYVLRVVNRKTATRSTLHLQPYADLTRAQRRLLPLLEEFLAIFFDTPVERLPRRRLEPRFLDRARGQYDADAIAAELAERVSEHSLGLFGLVGSDLYALELNFVFGVALLEKRAGVYSVHRFGSEWKPLLRRTLKLAAHEIGHMFGLHHCVFYECVLNGTNSLGETDRRPGHLCPVCLAKLKWNVHFDSARRYRRLAAFYRKHELIAEARFAEARAADAGTSEASADAGPDPPKP